MWEAIKHDWRTARISDGLHATLGFLQTLTLRPNELTKADADVVLSAGVGEQALVDAIHVAALFNMIDRLADSFGWHVPPDEVFHARSQAMLESGYTLLTPEQIRES